MSLIAKYKIGHLAFADCVVYALRKAIVVFVFLFLSISFYAVGQTTPATVKIVDADSKPIVGATLTWQQNKQEADAPPQAVYAVTDINGNALVDVESRINITVTAVGFEQRTFNLSRGESQTLILNHTVSTLEKVVVTGQFNATTPQQSAENVKVIDKATIDRLQVNNVRDLLQQQLNFRITEDNILGSNLTLHGLGGNNVKVLVDGVPVIGRENGNIDLGQLPLNNIEQVELVEGPMSVLYSSDATAGVINLITRRHSDGKHLFHASVVTESPRSLYTDASAWIQLRRSHVSLSGGRHYFDGYPKFDSTRVQQWKPSLKHYAGVGYGWKTGHSTVELKGDYFLQNTLDRGIPVKTPYEAYAFDTHYYTERINGAVFFNYNFGMFQLDQTAAVNTYSRSHQMVFKDLTTLKSNEVVGENADEQTDIYHGLYRVLLQQSQFRHKIRFQTGGEINWEKGSGDKILPGTAPIVEYAVLGQLEYAPVTKLLIKPGLRFNYNTAYAAPLIPSLNMRWVIDSNIQLRGAAARGYRAPALKELYLSFVDVNHNLTGNTDLVAETSWNGNLVLHLQRVLSASTVSFESSVYYHNISNQIVLVKSDSTALVYTYDNVDETVSTGVEFDAKFQARNVSVGMGMSFNGLTNTSLDSKTAWSPELSTTLLWDLPKPGLYFTLSYKNIGITPAYAFDANGSLQRYMTDGYALLDALLTKKLFHKVVSLSAGVKNILNVTNVQSALPSGVHDIGTGLAVARGRYFTAGLSFNFSRDIKHTTTPSNE